jgi:CubicO group peptidase (beta-lactamase class C family)
MHATASIDETGELTISGVTDPVPWWSFTKTVLCVAALRLVEKGSLTLDEALAGEPFSLRQLLRHEAGLPDYGVIARYHDDVAAGKAPWPVGRLLAATQASRLRYEPGNGWAYSNIGYLKVAQLIEQLSGQRLSGALAELVFEPAGMKTARLALTPGDLVDVQMGNATGYHPGWVYHGLVVGTVADAAHLLWLLAAGHLLKATTYAEMMNSRALPEHRSAIHPDPAYGLGLMLRAERPNDHPLGHNGEGPGSRIAVWGKSYRTAAVWTPLPSDVDAEMRVRELLD